jgi:hypothetical protein
VIHASRFLIGLMTRFATDDGIPRKRWIKTERARLSTRPPPRRIGRARPRAGLDVVMNTRPPPWNSSSGGEPTFSTHLLGRFLRPFPQPLGRSFPQVLVTLHDSGSAYACFGLEVGDAEDGVEAAAGRTR